MMASMASPTCPTCAAPVSIDATKKPPTFPFCSERCRTIDLGRWLNGEYRIPVRHVDEDEDGDVRPEPPPRSFDA